MGNTETYKIKNLNNGQYLASTDANNASKYLKFTTASNAGKYSISALQNVLAQHQLKCTTGNSSRNQLHASGAGVMNYNTGANDASSWYLIPATEIEISLAQMGNAWYGAYHFPFDVISEDPAMNFYGVKAWNKEDNKAMLVEMDGVKSGSGFIVEADKAKYTLQIKNEVTAPSFENLLSGVDAAKVVPSSATYYLLGEDAQGAVGLHKAKNREIKSNTAFLALPGNVATERFLFTLDEITGIGSVIVPAVDSEAIYYDLSGRRVQHPSRGVYIQNGKKVYIK